MWTDMRLIDLITQHLPYKYVKAIVSNVEEDKQRLYGDIDPESYKEGEDMALLLAQELLNLFDWEESKEGYDFWEDVHISIISDAQLPQLPIDIHYHPDTTFFMDNKIHVMNSAGLDFNLKFKYYKEDRDSFDRTIKEKFFSWCN